MGDQESRAAAARRFVWLLGQYRRRVIGVERLLAWLDADLAALGAEPGRELARAVRRRLAGPGEASGEETRAAVIDELVRASSRRWGDRPTKTDHRWYDSPHEQAEHAVSA